MSRLEVPLLGKPVWKTGVILLRAKLDLLIKDKSDGWRAETFRVDPGTEMTSMPAALARSRTAAARSRIRWETASSRHSNNNPRLAPKLSKPAMLNEPPSQRWALGLSRNSTCGEL